MRNFTFHPVEHYTEIRENGSVVATLYKTFNMTTPFRVFMKNGVNKAKQVSTIGEATDFILENSKQSEK